MTTITKNLIIFVFITIFIIASIPIFYLSTFNTKYKDIFKTTAQENNVSLALALSIAKTESKFNPNAKSSANAIGIMQIKLDTANYIRDLNNETLFVESDLYIPEINIEYGIKYIDYLFSKFENEDVVICAYNAGETVVRSWLANNTYSFDGETLHEIPYKETKNYLKKVKFNKKIYEKLVK